MTTHLSPHTLFACLWACALILVATSCDSDSDEDEANSQTLADAFDDGGDGTDAADAADSTDGSTIDPSEQPGLSDATLDITWTSCRFGGGNPFGGGGGDADCATIEVPLDWDTPDGPRIPYFVKRIPAASGPSTGMLWMLQGGPGVPGESLEQLAPAFAQALPNVDIYIPDHRGVGQSRLLGCAGMSALDTACQAQVRDELGEGGTEHFSVT